MMLTTNSKPQPNRKNSCCVFRELLVFSERSAICMRSVTSLVTNVSARKQTAFYSRVKQTSHKVEMPNFSARFDRGYDTLLIRARDYEF